MVEFTAGCGGILLEFELFGLFGLVYGGGDEKDEGEAERREERLSGGYCLVSLSFVVIVMFTIRAYGSRWLLSYMF